MRYVALLLLMAACSSTMTDQERKEANERNKHESRRN